MLHGFASRNRSTHLNTGGPRTDFDVYVEIRSGAFSPSTGRCTASVGGHGPPTLHCLAAREGRGGRVRVLSEDSCLVFCLFCFAEFMVQRQARHICDCNLRFGVDSVAAMLQNY